MARTWRLFYPTSLLSGQKGFLPAEKTRWGSCLVFLVVMGFLWESFLIPFVLILLLSLLDLLSCCCFQHTVLISADDFDILCIQLEQRRVADAHGFSGRTGEHHPYIMTEGENAKWMNATELLSLKLWRCNWAQWQEWCSINILNDAEKNQNTTFEKTKSYISTKCRKNIHLFHPFWSGD